MKIIADSSGNVSFNIEAVLDGMDAAGLANLADTLSINDAVIQNVIAQITEGATEAGSWAGHDECQAEPHRPMGIIRRRLAMSASEHAATQISGLSARLKAAEDTVRRMSDAAQRFRHVEYLNGDKAWEAMHRAEFPRTDATANEVQP